MRSRRCQPGSPDSSDFLDVPTDIVEVGHFGQRGHRPIPLPDGAVIGPGDPIRVSTPASNVNSGFMGTLGAIVQDDKYQKYILSCNHILAVNGRVPEGAHIVSTLTAKSEKMLATPDAFIRFDREAGNLVDCALVKLQADSRSVNEKFQERNTPQPRAIPWVSAEMADPKMKMKGRSGDGKDLRSHSRRQCRIVCRLQLRYLPLREAGNDRRLEGLPFRRRGRFRFDRGRHGYVSGHRDDLCRIRPICLGMPNSTGLGRFGQSGRAGRDEGQADTCSLVRNEIRTERCRPIVASGEHSCKTCCRFVIYVRGATSRTTCRRREEPVHKPVLPFDVIPS